jgi:hypothetical protein
MRIIRTKYYLISKQSKDSFGAWIGKPEISIITGHKARNERPYITDEFNPAFMVGNPSFELHDGHVRGHRPITSEVRRALDFLDNNKFSYVSIV